MILIRNTKKAAIERNVKENANASHSQLEQILRPVSPLRWTIDEIDRTSRLAIGSGEPCGRLPVRGKTMSPIRRASHAPCNHTFLRVCGHRAWKAVTN